MKLTAEPVAQFVWLEDSHMVIHLSCGREMGPFESWSAWGLRHLAEGHLDRCDETLDTGAALE